ncbi:P-loop ATPase, Sll1717 family [Sphingomonas sp. 35-24ZXX]|uniref:P-loop ATPase, Sll1717 family n=1 Tax=Sphingomonas sp. 35-24ZXX TaxID=1545915 RepID=UPI00053BF9A1|nr:hypothetical protein [Sphingomonas sp. 35-24ZXX]
MRFTEPLGPISADRLVDHPIASKRLFEKQNDVQMSAVSGSGIIIGRKGSGKTAFLDYLRTTCPHTVVYLDAPNVFPTILKSIRGVFGVNSPNVEIVAHLWEMLVWCTVFGALLNEPGDARLVAIRRFAIDIGFSENNEPADIIRRVVLSLAKRSEQAGYGIETQLDLLELVDGSGKLYTTALETAKRIVTPLGRPIGQARVLVLMDTMERYRLEQDAANDALGGLIRYLGVLAENEWLLDVRFCLPAELYETFRRASSNVTKDFSTQAVLHWTSGELWRIAAHRLALYLELYDEHSLERLLALNVAQDRASSIALFRKLLPPELATEPKLGQDAIGQHLEQSMTYIARHTQLLPRDFLHILNRILYRALDPASGSLGEITQRMVLDGVKEAVPTISDGIRSAFEYRYPHLWDVCAAAIPELHRRFGEGELHTVFNQHVKGVLKRLAEAGREADMSFHEFKRMLVETGAIGKQIDETDRFWECQFEYSVPGEMVVSSRDMLCVHPLFNARFSSLVNGTAEKLVYPYGVDPDFE